MSRRTRTSWASTSAMGTSLGDSETYTCSRYYVISVAQREAVARLDEFVGSKY